MLSREQGIIIPFYNMFPTSLGTPSEFGARVVGLRARFGVLDFGV